MLGTANTSDRSVQVAAGASMETPIKPSYVMLGKGPNSSQPKQIGNNHPICAAVPSLSTLRPSVKTSFAQNTIRRPRASASSIIHGMRQKNGIPSIGWFHVVCRTPTPPTTVSLASTQQPHVSMAFKGNIGSPHPCIL